MLSIIILHILGLGGVGKVAIANASASHYDLMKYFLVYGLDIALYCAVDCFGLISGFVGVTSSGKYNSFLKIWATVEFYSIILAVIPLLFGFISFEELSLKKMFFPVISGNYWYFTAYFVLALLMPFLNTLIRNVDFNSYRKLLIIIIILFSVSSLFNDCFKLDQGYHCLWLISLYLIGAYIRLHGYIIVNLKKSSSIALYLLFVLIVFSIHCYRFLFGKVGITELSYTSPFILLCAVLMLHVFSDLKINKCLSQIILVITPSVFPVYLIHEHFILHRLFFAERFQWIIQYNFFLIPFVIIFVALSVFVVCIIIDKIRYYLFIYLKINLIIDKIAKMINI